MSTFTKRISVNEDDGLAYYDGSWQFNIYDVFIGQYTGYSMITFFRFANCTIPQGATITSAKITLKAIASESTTNKTVSIYGNNVDNATAPTTYAQLVALAKTTANVTWTLPSVTNGSNYDTADIKDVVQEIVNRGSWASNNAMQFIIDTCSATTDMFKNFADVNTDSANAALLTIEYATNVQYTKTITVSINITSNLLRKSYKYLSKTINTTANVEKSSTKTLLGSTILSGTISSGIAYTKFLQGSINISGALSRTTNKIITAIVNTSGGILSRFIIKGITASINNTGTVIKNTTKTIIGSAIFTGSAAKAYGKTLVASITSNASIFNRSVNRILSTLVTATGSVIKLSNRQLSGITTITATNTKSTYKLLENCNITLSGEIDIYDDIITINNIGTAPIGLGSQEGAIFNIIVTGTFTSFTIVINGKTLTYTDDIVDGSVTIYNTTANVTDRTKLTGDTSEYLTLLPGINIIEITKVGGSVDFNFKFTPLFV